MAETANRLFLVQISSGRFHATDALHLFVVLDSIFTAQCDSVAAASFVQLVELKCLELHKLYNILVIRLLGNLWVALIFSSQYRVFVF